MPATTSRTSDGFAGRSGLDLTIDPPPDLAIEVDITSSSLDRQGIYAALGVPEIWRFDGESLRVYQIQADGTYMQCESSPTFPFLPLEDVVRFATNSECDGRLDLDTLLPRLGPGRDRPAVHPAGRGGGAGLNASGVGWWFGPLGLSGWVVSR